MHYVIISVGDTHGKLVCDSGKREFSNGKGVLMGDGHCLIEALRAYYLGARDLLISRSSCDHAGKRKKERRRNAKELHDECG
jgi:hypothetical protein